MKCTIAKGVQQGPRHLNLARLEVLRQNALKGSNGGLNGLSQGHGAALHLFLQKIFSLLIL